MLCRKSAGSAEIKSFRDQEVEIIRFFGKRLESTYRFLTLDEFEEEFDGQRAEEILPDAVTTCHDELGQEVRGVTLFDPSVAGRKLVFYSDEIHAHKERVSFLFG